jgi:hypothetical protein
LSSWQFPEVVRTRRKFVRESLPPEAHVRALPTLLRRAGPGSQVAAFESCVAALREDGRVRSLSAEARERLARTAVRVLERAKIGTNGSKLSSRHDDLFSALALRLDVARLGTLAEEKGRAVVARTIAVGAPSTWDEEQERVRHLRWMADYFQAEAELETIARRDSPAARTFAARERVLQAIGRDSDLARALPIAPGDTELVLWAYAIPERTFLTRMPRLAQGVPSALAAAYNLSLAKAVRWARLLAALEDGAALLNAQELALALAATARWLLRVREKAHAQTVLEAYGRLSLALTQGFTRDVLALFAELAPPERESQAVPVAWKRAGALSSLSLEISLLLGRTRFASLFGREERRKRLREEEAQALVDICVRHFRELKGPVMKLGQTASYFGLRLPAISNSALERLQSEAAPLDASIVTGIVERELGAKLTHVFAEFEATPSGVGSIGQVHRARLQTGERVAVKVQFPGIEEAIGNDLALLRICFPVIRLLSVSAMRRDLFDELERQLRRECDYRNEARLHKKLAESFAHAPGLRFPRLYEALSTERVLVTEWIEGKNFNEFVASATPEERDSAGHWLTEYVVRSCCRGTFNSDPHPGNFMFANGQVVCLDFGAVKEWDPKYTVPWAELILAGVDRDYPRFVRAIQNMGIVADRNNLNPKYFFDVYTGGSMGNTSVDERRCMSHEELHRELEAYFNRTVVGHLYFNPEYLLGVRVYTGLIAITASLKASNNFFSQIRSICLETLPPSALNPNGF